MTRLWAVAAGLALLTACGPEFQGDRGVLGFLSNLGGWTPATAVALGMPLQIAVNSGPVRAEVDPANPESALPYDWTGAITGDLHLSPRDDPGTFEITADRPGSGRVTVRAEEAAADGTHPYDTFTVQFAEPHAAWAAGAPRLAVVVGTPCQVPFGLVDARGAHLGSDPDGLAVFGDGPVSVWSGEGGDQEVIVSRAGSRTRLEASYGTFGDLRGPVIIGVTKDQIDHIDLRSEVVESEDAPITWVVAQPYTADGTPVACVPLAWDIPEGVAAEPLSSDADARMLRVVGDGVPPGLEVHVAR